MQGLYVDGSRPRSKKAVREAIADDPGRVRVEATSMFGDEYGGPLTAAPSGNIAFVGPDPYTRRNYYGTIEVRRGDASGPAAVPYRVV
jgi:hypothetical protein